MALMQVRHSIGAQIHQILRDAIVRTELMPGVALSESEIAARYQVSRQPVREAFIRLAQEGLVDVRPQRGTFVKRILASEVVDARFVREAIELAITREAALQASAEDVARLWGLLDEQRRVEGREAMLQADEALHREIARIARRESAWRVVDQIKAQMDRVRYLSYLEINPAERLIGQHEAIVEAVAAHDVIAAEQAVKTHMSDLLGQVEVLAARYPELFESPGGA